MERLLPWKRQLGFARFILIAGVLTFWAGVPFAPPASGQDSESLAAEVAGYSESDQQEAPVLLTNEAVVAILPFEIHSARPIQHLAEALPSLLSARLDSTGKVAVVAIWPPGP
mgnify:CR=1 FL=1